MEPKPRAEVPRSAEFILDLLLPPKYHEAVIGDLQEQYEKRLAKYGERRALRRSQSRLEAAPSVLASTSSKVSESDRPITDKPEPEPVEVSYRLVEGDNTDDAYALETYEDYK